MMQDSQRAEKIIGKLIPFSWIIVVIFVGLTYFAFPKAVGLISSISTQLSKLLPDDFPSVKLGNEVKKKFKKKGGDDLILILDSPNPGNNRKARDAIVEYLQKIPEVGQVRVTKTAFDFFDKHKLLYMDLKDIKKIRDRTDRKIQREKLGGLYIDFESVDTGGGKDPFQFGDLIEKYREDYLRGIKSKYYTNSDETIFALWIYPKSKDSSLSYYKKFFNIIDLKMKDFSLQEYGSDINISYAGSIRTRIDEYTSLIGDLKRAGIISLAGIFLLLIIYFRSLVSVILSFLPLASGILLGFAICSYFIDQLNVVTSFLFSILFGLGIDVGIHMFARYTEDREAGVSQERSLTNILLKTGRSSLIAIATTCAVFFLLIINDFRGFSEFGIIAGIGLVVTLITYLVFFPPVLIIAEKLRLLRFRRKRHEAIQARLEKWKVFPHSKKVTYACFIFLIFAFVLLPFIKFEWNYHVLRIQVMETEGAREKLRAVSGRVNSPAAIQLEGEQDAIALKEEFLKRKEGDKETPTIDYYRSSHDLYPPDQEEKMRILKDIDRLLADDALNVLKGTDREMVDEFRRSVAISDYVRREEIPTEVRDAFFGKGEFAGEQVSFVYPLPNMELDDGRNAIQFYEDVHEVEVNGKKFYAVSDAIIFADVLRTMFRDSRRVVILSLIALLVIIYLDFRNWKKVGLIFGSLAFGVVGMGGIIVLLGWKLNFFNMVTIPVVLGMGIDNSVHLYHRYSESKERSVMEALFTSGTAGMMASLTTMLGYSGLIFAHHPGLRSIGELAVAGMATCMIGSLIFLPAVLQFLKNKKT